MFDTGPVSLLFEISNTFSLVLLSYFIYNIITHCTEKWLCFARQLYNLFQKLNRSRPYQVENTREHRVNSLRVICFPSASRRVFSSVEIEFWKRPTWYCMLMICKRLTRRTNRDLNTLWRKTFFDKILFGIKSLRKSLRITKSYLYFVFTFAYSSIELTSKIILPSRHYRFSDLIVFKTQGIHDHPVHTASMRTLLS